MKNRYLKFWSGWFSCTQKTVHSRYSALNRLRFYLSLALDTVETLLVKCYSLITGVFEFFMTYDGNLSQRKFHNLPLLMFHPPNEGCVNSISNPSSREGWRKVSVWIVWKSLHVCLGLGKNYFLFTESISAKARAINVLEYNFILFQHFIGKYYNILVSAITMLCLKVKSANLQSQRNLWNLEEKWRWVGRGRGGGRGGGGWGRIITIPRFSTWLIERDKDTPES